MRRLRRWWAGARWWRRFLAVIGLVLLVAVLWIGQGVLSVLWQGDDYAAYWDARAQEEGDLVLVALGDSAAQGIGATDPQRGYVGLLADRIEAATGRQVQVVNLAVSGAVAAELVAEQLPQLADLDPDLITVAIGGNDALDTASDPFRASVEAMLDVLPPGTFVADLPDFGGGPSLEDARALSRIVREELLARPELVGVALEEATGANGWLDYAPDFFHPDDSGYVRWADAFWEQIEPRL